MISGLLKKTVGFVLIQFLAFTVVRSQCVLSIANLPDTMKVCRNSTIQFNPNFVFTGGTATPTDTTWSPATGLSNIHALNPIATIGTTNIQYNLSVTSITGTNFVNNGDFSQGNTGFSSSYIDTNGPGSLWPEGYYSIQTNPNNVHPNFASFGDHTSGTGLMMVINGASSPVNIWCQTIAVTPNTSYDFSAWGASCTPSNPAQLQFEINGVLVGTALQLPGTNGVWTEFHVVWNSGSNTSITICIHDNQTALSGNDFAIDDISFKQICVVTDSVYINVENILPAIQSHVKLGCLTDTVFFTAVNHGTMPDNYKWNFGDGTISTLANPYHVYATRGVYTVQLNESTVIGCGDSATTTVDTRHSLSVNFAVTKDTICATQSIQFINNDIGTQTPLSYFWDFGDGTTDNTAGPSHQYNTPGIYTVMHTVSDQVPCSDTMYMQVVVLPGPTLDLSISDSLICLGKTITMTGGLSAGFKSVIWNFGDNSYNYDINPANHTYDQAGTYVVELTATFSQCPPVNAIKKITILPYPLVNLGPDTSMCPWTKPIALTNIHPETLPVSYLWSTGQIAPAISVDKPGTYWLTETTPGGCSTTDSILVAQSCYIEIPNVFTPNGDGINDYFFPRQLLTRQLVQFHMDIYNRWGEVIFSTDNIDGRGWDGKYNGKNQPEGVYIYKIEATPDGMSQQSYKGNVTLIR
jgi:gliding motility-associated-like protein